MTIETCSILKLPNIGNIDSVALFFRSLGLLPNIVDSDCRAKSTVSDLLILPGVGAFDKAVSSLMDSRALEVLQLHIENDLPLIGICLGFQLLCASSTEVSLEDHGIIDGLGVFDDVNMIDLSTLGLKINVGAKLLQNKFVSSVNLPPNPFYFMHRYACTIEENNCPKSLHSYVVHQNTRLTSSCRHGNIWGFQFHPEKSGQSGFQFMTSVISSFN